MVIQIILCVIGGLLIMIAPILSEKVSKKWKVFTWSVFIVFGIAYIVIGIWLANDNQKSRDADRTNIKNLTKEIKDSKAKADQLIEVLYKPEIEAEKKRLNEILEKVEKELATLKKPEGEKTVAGIAAKAEVVRGLKSRAIDLSYQIIQFLLERQKSEPMAPRPETLTQDVDRSLKYSQETMNLYSLKFATEVIAIRNELANKGLQDNQLEFFYLHVMTPFGIRIVAERISALAEQLP